MKEITENFDFSDVLLNRYTTVAFSQFFQYLYKNSFRPSNKTVNLFYTSTLKQGINSYMMGDSIPNGDTYFI